MDYAIGSVADIISGKSTPNKPKVIKRKLPKPPLNNNIEPSEKQQKEADTQEREKKKFKKRKLKESTNDQTSLTVIDHNVLEQLESQAADALNESDNNVETADHTESSFIIDPELKAEQDARTLFVGNISIQVTKKQLKKFFRKYGPIECVRLRCATPAVPGMSKKLTVMKRKFHDKRTTLHCYVRYENREDAVKATELNKTSYKGHHLRVELSDNKEKPASTSAIFVGNLPFDVEDDALWEAFEVCGPIKSVRVVRNSATGMGIGIGYVNFESSDSVEFALEMEDVQINGRPVRIKRSVEQKNKPKRYETSKAVEDSNRSDTNAERQKKDRVKPKLKSILKTPHRINLTVKNSVFQGSKSAYKKKKKPKFNKGMIQKMKLVQKIAPKAT